MIFDCHLIGPLMEDFPNIRKLKRPERIPVENTFNEFVKEFGGELVSELMPKNQNLPRNADYLFRDNRVVAELKCFEKDLFNNDEDIARLEKLIKKWISNGSISGHHALRWALGQEKLPLICAQDMINLAVRTIETAIKSAKEQIKQTKDYFHINNGKGLLLLANDGNYFLEHQELFGLICRIMGKKFMNSSIDGIVYFSDNMPSKVPWLLREMSVWFPAYRKENDELGDFVNELGAKWISFFQRKIGEEEIPPYQLNDPVEIARLLNSMKLIKSNKPTKN